jgi:hypothetical protein
MTSPTKLFRVVVVYTGGSDQEVSANVTEYTVTNDTPKSYMVRETCNDAPKRSRNIPKDSVGEIVLNVQSTRSASAHVWVFDGVEAIKGNLVVALSEEFGRVRKLAESAIDALETYYLK